MRVVDLFSGCGGLSLGFENAGYNIVAAYDNWQPAITVYEANFNHPIFNVNLSDEDSAVKYITEHRPDMIIGGPPCQDFSSAGKRNENNGRGDLTISYAKIISTLRPSWFVMENVSTITKTTKLAVARDLFKKSGYGLTQIVLNAALCGVPQRRKRFIMIGHLGAQDDFMLDVIKNRLSHKEMTVKDYFGEHLDVEYYYRHPRSYARRGIFSVNEPSPTIRGVNRPIPDGYKIHSNDPIQSLSGVRPLTTKERSMIQTFPENFTFIGGKSDLEQMIGNAVPVKLGEFIASAINTYIETPKGSN
uniref:Cytosine-specific methyltransferase n=2 Tax=unclassified bacterial viruses TaxID=12333 RepID=A0A8S5R7E9_9VIRU|nr:MAG TPA: Cytosine specific methyltransferase [virus sp. cthq354]DAE27620.1 MAG TPA: Cytosine specific methyltransferase [virus sp. ctf7E27]